jgi:hypothetical protein
MSGQSLPQMVNTPKLRPTPQAHDHHKGNPARVGRFGTMAGGRNLNDEVAMFPTPTANCSTGAGTSGRDGGMNLQTAVKMLSTPASRDYRSPNSKPYSERGGGSKGEQLPNAVCGQLNPDWVEWLMGWPIGWTGLGPLNPAAFREWQEEFRIVSDGSNASATAKSRRAL